jgi:hypothetical protein
MTAFGCPLTRTFIQEVTVPDRGALAGCMRMVLDLPDNWLGVLGDLLEKLNGKNGKVWLDELLKFLRREPCWVKVAAETLLTDLITAGEYDWVHQDITEKNFPMPPNFVLGVEPKLFHFNRKISSENAIKEMEKEGYRPATIWDLLDYGVKNPEMQRQFPITALGSITMTGDRRKGRAALRGSDSERDATIFWGGYSWGDNFRFLAVRNK